MERERWGQVEQIFYAAAMEMPERRTLKTAISGKALDLETVLDLSTQIADALAAVHAKGIVHRDIKSANIFVRI